MEDTNMLDFSGLRIRLASPKDILGWSHGEVTKPETINYRTFRPEKDGLFDERIFGPTKDYECYCGKYKRIRYKGIICDRCGVEVTSSVVRRERMGHLKLATPVAHIWYFKGASSPLSILLDIPTQTLERIVYYALFIVTDVDEKRQAEVEVELEKLKAIDVKKQEVWYEDEKTKLKKTYNNEKESIKKKISNTENREITLQEVDLKERASFRKLSDRYVERKSKYVAMYDRLIKVVKSLKLMDTFEEEDYLFLKDFELHDFVEVGMGAEVLQEILAEQDLKEMVSETMSEISKTRGEKRSKLIKKVRILESFIRSGASPEWMMISILPVIPPDLRPVVQLPGGKFATSDLNDLYRRVINRNIRLSQLIELGAPEIILRNEKRMLQESVDSLLDLQKSRGRTQTRRSAKKLKSLSDVLKGKQGRFRQNLLGKRVDYSGRSTIIVGPDLKIDQCGIPKEMALELFKPYLLHEIIIRGLAPNIKSAKNYLEERQPEIYDILEKITVNHPVLLNRAPTLHKLSILGFYPVLTDDNAIKLHPTVCSGYNADFDGDAMGVFVPLSEESIKEVRERMLPYQNLLKPADGSPIVIPNKEMALGIYYLTTLDKHAEQDKTKLRIFSNQEECLKSYRLDQISLRQPIVVRISGEIHVTSVGRVMFNETLPEVLRYNNSDVTAGDIKNIIVKAMEHLNQVEVGEVIDKIKNLGFWGATVSCGLSISIFDCKIIDDKDKIIQKTEKDVAEILNNYNQGLLTLEEKKRITNKLWIDVTEDLADKTWDAIDEENPVKIIIRSGGARASREQLKQLSAMKGLVVDPMGKIIEVPTKSNYREGLNTFEYVISARGARKGLTDSALKTADAGYLTRRLHDVAHDMIIREEDCGTERGLEIFSTGERGDKLALRIDGRFTAEPVVKGKKILVPKNTLIEKDVLKLILDNEIDHLTVRTTLFCQSKIGVCQMCYGTDLSSHKIVEIGVPVGVIAAQSIGEPGTQLTMRVRHFGGIVIADVTQGLPRVEELFETRNPKVVSPITEVAGKISISEDPERDMYKVTVTPTNNQEEAQEFSIPTTQKLKVEDGDMTPSGTQLSEGYLNIKDILSIKGLDFAQQYLLNEVQAVYESQGIGIHDKHFEVIIRKMSDKVVIDDEGDTELTKNEVISRVTFNDENKKALAVGGKPAIGKVTIFGITRAAIYTESWLSAASFEQTTSVLSQAAIAGKVDNLLGLKENVIIGRLIPVTQELITKYYTKLTKQYANDQPAGEESTDDKQEEVPSSSTEEQL
ncbi:DNA-directed RNA polymerase subunit beta' [Candidatus Roizmanbacteria bacterium CG11_big_fil_rev_8_21_14_0_20_36_8]|uniref:DNA-directed RNA polymerase subunit beta' n=2 Tax=Candidatus Roizmaniibacteriota TaxID=1752723 RepID=A0A2M6IUG8_9BACT|nr:MAG: DNA-directed RNA polymerase subunit beta' [Candidatus Roizmanbacteria bacterium CG11_big_fil_rev_8_21_14_0_20_36_8]PIZ64799.1 MAG: DNA-directed RNA polymerase subunit beta' [Candidatus Roizmanbacteria bacterium CG_4_10_14_0_2_um_filter_36_9]